MIAEWIAHAAARQGGAPYLEDGAGTGTLTYASLRRSTRVWADCLDRAGVPPGAQVAVRLPDPLSYATALVSILGAGRVVIPLDPGAPAAELSRVLAAARPQAAVGESDDGLPPGLAVLRPPDRSFGPNGPRPSPAAERAVIPDGASRESGSGGIFLCTSGTTGAPKGIALREDQLCHVAASVAGHHRLTPSDRGYCCLPLFHVNAEVVGLLATLTAGACLGWLDTGDLGHLDQDGYLFLAGRSDDVINRGGEKIYPREIEDVLLAQPGVRSAAVVAAHDEVLGERPVAYVVPTEPWPRELADALREACAAALPRPKRPSAFYLVRDLPLGPTGKVARRRLRELAAGRHS